MVTVILLLVFGFVFTVILGIYNIFTAEQRLLAKRIETYTSKARKHDILLDKSRPAGERFSLKSFFQQVSKIFASGSLSKKIEAELDKADLPLRGEEFILINLITAFVPAFIFLVLTANIPLVLAIAGIGLIIPRIFLSIAKQKRLAKFNNQISDSLVVMANSLRAGFSFIQAMEMVSKEMPPPISVEFARTLREINLGTPTEEALNNLIKRVESDDLDLVITAVLIQRQVGGNLSEVLDNISHTIRERVRIKGEIKTMTAQGRMSGMIIGALPVVICAFLFIINPSYMSTLFTNPIGIGLLVSGVVSQLIGVFFIKKIINIEV